MRRAIHCILLACLLTTGGCLTALAQKDSAKVYSQEHPLIYEDAWDLWPYTFLNESGEPDGYNLDLLKIIFKELDIPYVVKLKPAGEASRDLLDGRCDLIFALDTEYQREFGTFGKSIVQLFTHSVVYPKGYDEAIRKVGDIRRQKVIVHRDSYTQRYMNAHGMGENAIPYEDMKDAIRKISSEKAGQIVWNTMSLKFLLRKYQTGNLEIDPIDLPYCEYKFMSNDPRLLEQMDSVYVQLRASDKLQEIQNKWFYPERKVTGIPYWIWELVAALALVVMGIVIYYVVYRFRERKMTKAVRKSNDRLSLILRTSKVSFWTYNVVRKTFTWMDERGREVREYTTQEFSRRYRAEDFEQLRQAIDMLIRGQQKTVTFEMSALEQGEGSDEHDYHIALTVLRRQKNGKPSVIICTRSDITDELIRQRKTKDMMLRYQSIFNTAMVDMVYFNEKGRLEDLNNNACTTLNSSREELIARKPSVKEIVGDNDLDSSSLDYYYATIIHDDNKGYYEQQLVPVYNDDHRLLGIYGTGRDVTEVARSYQHQQERIRQLRRKTQQVDEYLRNIDYVLDTGGVRIADYSPDTHTLTVYHKTNVVQFTMTQSRIITFVHEDSKKLATRLLHSMDNKTHDIIDGDIKTNIHWKGDGYIYLHANFVPFYAEDGTLVHYRGMFRDVSEMKTTENELELQTIKAQEVEVVKNAFLHNMSYEIRTPLNTVVGFAELFSMEHESADEPVFISEMKENSSKLLKLINDILFLSRLDAGMIEFKPKPVDFALAFESKCQAAWAIGQQPSVQYIVQSPYERLVVEVDDLNLNIIIEKIINNAVQHTTAGSVLARYDYIGDYLVISIEDTGCGIPKASIEHIFERFVTGANNGAGLGLSICHELVRQMGGTIQLKSTEGKGTTVWFTIPCKALEIVRN